MSLLPAAAAAYGVFGLAAMLWHIGFGRDWKLVSEVDGVAGPLLIFAMAPFSFVIIAAVDLHFALSRPVAAPCSCHELPSDSLPPGPGEGGKE